VAAALAAGLAAAPGGLGGGAITLNSAAAQSAGGGADLGADAGADVGVGGAEVGAGAEVGVGSDGVDADVGADVDAGTDDDTDADSDSDGGSDSGSGSDTGTDSDADADAGADDDAGADVAAGGSSSADDQGAAQPDPDSAAEGLEDQPGVRPIDRRYTYFTSLNVQTAAFQRYGKAAERNDLKAASEALTAATNRPVTIELVDYVNAELGVQTALAARQIAAAANGVPAYRISGEITSAADELTSGSAGQ
jgi:hypothetical protein